MGLTLFKENKEIFRGYEKKPVLFFDECIEVDSNIFDCKTVFKEDMYRDADVSKIFAFLKEENWVFQKQGDWKNDWIDRVFNGSILDVKFIRSQRASDGIDVWLRILVDVKE